MDPRLHFITLATPDLDAVRAFYRDGLGWPPLLDVPDEIVFFQVGPGLVLGFFERTQYIADVAGAVADPSTSGVTLAHNVSSRDEVDRLVRLAAEVGGRVVKPPQPTSFGGYHGHVADPNGVLWEICHNPGWSVAEDGRVSLG